MSRHRRPRSVLATSCILAGLAVLFAVPGASAQELYTFSASAMIGVGGSPDAERGDGVDQSTFQLGLSMLTEPQTFVGLRYGEIGFDDGPLGDLFDADLTYLTLSGEYKFDENFYDAGIYIGLGGYRLEGRRAGAGRDGETALGMSLGATGDFPITRRFGVLVELSGHYTDLDETQFFAMGHVGVSFRF